MGVAHSHDAAVRPPWHAVLHGLCKPSQHSPHDGGQERSGRHGVRMLLSTRVRAMQAPLLLFAALPRHLTRHSRSMRSRPVIFS